MKKEPIIAYILNFVLPGAGHLYCGSKQAVWLMSANIAAWGAIGAGLDFFFVVVLGTFIYSMATTASAVSQANVVIETEEQASREEKSKKDIQKKQEELRQFSVSDFVGQLNKMAQLRAADLINDEEFRAKKLALIASLGLKILSDQPDDFLLAIAPYVKSATLEEKEVKEIKVALASATFKVPA